MVFETQKRKEEIGKCVSLLELTAKELRGKIASGEIKSVDVTEAVFSRIEKYEGLSLIHI